MRSVAIASLLAALVATGCASVTITAGQSVASPSSITWRTLGCAEPAPLESETSPGREEDVGLAAESLAKHSGVSLDEAKRQLRLQEVLGNAMAEMRLTEPNRLARTEIQREPTFAAVITLTGTSPISEQTRAILCRTPELEVRLDAPVDPDAQNE